VWDPKLRSQIDREVQKARRGRSQPQEHNSRRNRSVGRSNDRSDAGSGYPSTRNDVAPVIAGLVFIAYSVGLDAFCRWANDHVSFHADFPNQDHEE
jgi:hypothetical protein